MRSDIDLKPTPPLSPPTVPLPSNGGIGHHLYINTSINIPFSRQHQHPQQQHNLHSALSPFSNHHATSVPSTLPTSSSPSTLPPSSLVWSLQRDVKMTADTPLDTRLSPPQQVSNGGGVRIDLPADENIELEELEEFAKEFKQRRIKLGYTQVEMDR